jgi:hypothetical protein
MRGLERESIDDIKLWKQITNIEPLLKRFSWLA